MSGDDLGLTPVGLLKNAEEKRKARERRNEAAAVEAVAFILIETDSLKSAANILRRVKKILQSISNGDLTLSFIRDGIEDIEGLKELDFLLKEVAEVHELNMRLK